MPGLRIPDARLVDFIQKSGVAGREQDGGSFPYCRFFVYDGFDFPVSTSCSFFCLLFEKDMPPIYVCLKFLSLSANYDEL